MKKRFLSMLLIASCFGFANAQLVVDETGKVGVGIEATSGLLSKLTLNGLGKSDSEVYMTSSKANTLYVNRSASSTGILSAGINCTSVSASSAYNAGIYTTASGSSSHTASFGLLANSQSASAGLCAGVYGIIGGTSNTKGAAILGNAVNTSLAFNVGGRYAGYFYGDTRVTGMLTAGSLVTSSDYRLKDNVRSLSSSDGCLGKLMSMNVVEYNNKQREYEVEEADLDGELLEMDSTVSIMGLRDNKVCWYEEDSPIINNKHYGLIAQELREIYPDLVVESQDGFLAINYLEIIPLLIRSVQELKAELDASKSDVKKAATRSVEEVEATAIDAVVNALYQNEPNPFTESTLIRCDVAEDVVKADLYIYTMNGEQLAEYTVAERGETSVTIDGGSLSAGMYLYALIADGKVVDTKRMILTK